MSLAQQAMDSVVMYQEGVTVTPDDIYIGLDINPFDMFKQLGLTMVESDHELYTARSKY